MGYAISQYFLSAYYSRLAVSCGQTFNATIPEPYSSACVDDLMEAVDLALSYRTDATGSEALSYICATVGVNTDIHHLHSSIINSQASLYLHSIKFKYSTATFTVPFSYTKVNKECLITFMYK